MINSVNLATQTIQPTQPIPFTSNKITTGCSARHESGSAIFRLLKCGIYNIKFNTAFNTLAAGNVIFAVQSNGEPISGSKITVTSDGKSTYSCCVNIPVRVYDEGAVNISVNSLSTVPVNVFDSNIVIERICG